MKKKRMIISTVFATIFLMLSFAGCGKLLADGSQATTITSTQTQNASLQPSVEQMPTSPPKPTATTIPSPATTPTFFYCRLFWFGPWPTFATVAPRSANFLPTSTIPAVFRTGWRLASKAIRRSPPRWTGWTSGRPMSARPTSKSIT